MKTIIEKDIDIYTAFLENVTYKYHACDPSIEGKYKKEIELHEKILNALQDLKTFLGI